MNRAGRRSLPRLNHAAVRDQPNAAKRAAERAGKGKESVSMGFFFMEIAMFIWKIGDHMSFRGGL